MSKERTKHACALSVAGSDSGGGAGIQADLLTFAANGVYGCTAIAALTAQNPDGVYAASSPDAPMLRAQLDAVCRFYKPQAAKTGMLFDAEIAEAAADFFSEHPEISLVADPVMISTSGAKLLKDDAVKSLKKRLLPIATLITPNLDEGAALLGEGKIANAADAARKLRDMFGTSVLLKGGHGAGDDISDILASVGGETIEIKSKRVSGVNTHGSGCTLSAAIAANLAKGESLADACKNAQKYILACMKNPLETAGGKFINHFPES